MLPTMPPPIRCGKSANNQATKDSLAPDMPPPNAPQSSRSLPPTLNELLVDIRDRMPVILATRDYARWLGDEPDPGNLMQPFPADSMLESVELADSGRTL